MNRAETRRAMRTAGYRRAPGKSGRRSPNRMGIEARRVPAAQEPAVEAVASALRDAGFVIARPKIAVP